MRRYNVAAENIFVFIHTNNFNNDPFYWNGASARFAETTKDTGEVVALAVRLGESLWRDGFRYSKRGPMGSVATIFCVVYHNKWALLHIW